MTMIFQLVQIKIMKVGSIPKEEIVEVNLNQTKITHFLCVLKASFNG